MITARYTWEISVLEKGFSIHRKRIKLLKAVPILAIVFIAIGVYQAFTAERSWIEGCPLLFLSAFPLIWCSTARILAISSRGAPVSQLRVRDDVDVRSSAGCRGRRRFQFYFHVEEALFCNRQS